MRRRSNEEGLTCWYWGKITGTDNDYLVVIGHGPGKGCVSKKFFFWYACRPACCTPQLPCCCGCDAAIWQHRSLFVRALRCRIATAHQTTSCCKRCRRCLRCVAPCLTCTADHHAYLAGVCRRSLLAKPLPCKADSRAIHRCCWTVTRKTRVRSVLWQQRHRHPCCAPPRSSLGEVTLPACRVLDGLCQCTRVRAHWLPYVWLCVVCRQGR